MHIKVKNYWRINATTDDIPVKSIPTEMIKIMPESLTLGDSNLPNKVKC